MKIENLKKIVKFACDFSILRVEIDGKGGEYTGFSFITWKHYFSMYDGSVIKLSEMEVLRKFGLDFLDRLKMAKFRISEAQKN